MLWSAALNMPANLETQQWPQDWKRSVFHSNPKERQCQRMLKLLHNCTHLTCKHSNTQNSPSQASALCEPWIPDVQAGLRKGRGTRDQIANIRWIIKKARDFQKKTSISALLTIPKPLTVWITINWKIRKEMGIPDHLTCLLRNLYAGQEATVRTGHGTTDWF